MIVIECRPADVRALASVPYREVDLADAGRDWSGLIVKKPWGHEVEIYQAGALSMWRLMLQAGAETSMHCHPGKRTVLMVELGRCVIETLSGQHDLGPGDIAHIEPGAFHRTRTREGVTLIEVETPPNKNCLVRLADKYGRQGRGYEVA